jgi:hypothetical protein
MLLVMVELQRGKCHWACVTPKASYLALLDSKSRSEEIDWQKNSGLKDQQYVI